MIEIIADSTMSVPVGWVLASGAALAGSISTLATIIYKSQQQQINALRKEVSSVKKINSSQAETIRQQNKIMLNLQSDIKDLKTRIRKYEEKH